MRSRKRFYVLVAVTVVMVAAAVLSRQPVDEPAASYGLHAPDLAARADDLRSIEIRTADETLRLVRADGGWTARSETGYPADAARIRQVVLGLGNLQRLDKKTSDPERLHRLELTGVDQPGSKAVRVTLLAEGGDALADVLVGKTQDFQQDGRSRYFVREAGDPQAWLVEGSLPPVLEETANWLQQALMPGVGEAGLRRVSVTHADGATVRIMRDAPGDENFRLVGLSDGEKPGSQSSINALARTLRGLSLKEVRAGTELDDPAATVEALTFNGVRIVARIASGEPDYRVRLSAAYEPGEDRKSADGEGKAGGEALARDLNERWRDRVFVVSQYALDSLLARRADLLEQTGSSEDR